MNGVCGVDNRHVQPERGLKLCLTSRVIQDDCEILVCCYAGVQFDQECLNRTRRCRIYKSTLILQITAILAICPWL